MILVAFIISALLNVVLLLVIAVLLTIMEGMNLDIKYREDYPMIKKYNEKSTKYH